MNRLLQMEAKPVKMRLETGLFTTFNSIPIIDHMDQ